MMKKRRILWVASGLVAFLIAAAPVAYYLLIKASGEHFYRLRPTSYWAGQMRRWQQGYSTWTVPWVDKVLVIVGTKGPTDRPAIMEAGSAAIPVLLDLLDSEESGVRAMACALLTYSSVVPEDLAAATLARALQARASDVRLCVLETLPLENPQAKEAVPALIQVLNDPNCRVRQMAIEVLAPFGPEAQQAIPALRVCLSDNTWQVREAAADALQVIELPGDAGIRESVDRLLRQNRREYFRPTRI
jgi:HEAT repeat protein